MANTPNLGLHQWQPGDAFLRTDFNMDFSKIDREVESATRVVRLKEYTAPTAAEQVDLNVADIDFTVYRRVNLYVENMRTETGTSIFMRLNNISAADSYYSCGLSNYMLSLGNPKDYSSIMIIHICGRNGLLGADFTAYGYFRLPQVRRGCAKLWRGQTRAGDPRKAWRKAPPRHMARGCFSALRVGVTVA